MNSAENAEQERVFDDGGVERHPAASVNVLVADDDPLTRRLMWVLLRRRGYTVAIADGGRRAMDQLRTKRSLTVAVVDIQLPDVDGFMVASSLRLEEPERDLHLIAVTANDHPRARVLSLHAGFDDHVCKPFDPEALFFIIENRARERLKLRQAAQRAEAAPEQLQQGVADAARALGPRGWAVIARRFGPMADTTLAAIGKAMRRGDMKLVTRLAHGFAGAAAQLGLLSTALLARELELGAVQNVADQLPALLLQLEDSVADGCDRLARATVGS